MFNSQHYHVKAAEYHNPNEIRECKNLNERSASWHNAEWMEQHSERIVHPPKDIDH